MPSPRGNSMLYFVLCLAAVAVIATVAIYVALRQRAPQPTSEPLSNMAGPTDIATADLEYLYGRPISAGSSVWSQWRYTNSRVVEKKGVVRIYQPDHLLASFTSDTYETHFFREDGYLNTHDAAHGGARGDWTGVWRFDDVTNRLYLDYDDGSQLVYEVIALKQNVLELLPIEIEPASNTNTDADATKDWSSYTSPELGYTVHYVAEPILLEQRANVVLDQRTYTSLIHGAEDISLGIPEGWIVDVNTAGEALKIVPPDEDENRTVLLQPNGDACPFVSVGTFPTKKAFDAVYRAMRSYGSFSWASDAFSVQPLQTSSRQQFGLQLTYFSAEGTKLYHWCIATPAGSLRPYWHFSSGLPLDGATSAMLANVKDPTSK